MYTSTKGPFEVPAAALAASTPIALSARECVSAMHMIAYMSAQTKHIADIDGNTESFRPHMSLNVSNALKLLCQTLSLKLKQETVNTGEVVIKCPICEEVLVRARQSDDQCFFEIGTDSSGYSETSARFMHCNGCTMDIDTCVFTMLPYDTCSIDREVESPEVWHHPLRCSICGTTGNTCRRNDPVSSGIESPRIEYNWLPNFSDMCPYCSIPMLPVSFF